MIPMTLEIKEGVLDLLIFSEIYCTGSYLSKKENLRKTKKTQGRRGKNYENLKKTYEHLRKT